MKRSFLKIFSIIASLCVAIALLTGCNKKVEVSALEGLTPLSHDDFVAAAELIKSNIQPSDYNSNAFVGCTYLTPTIDVIISHDVKITTKEQGSFSAEKFAFGISK